MSRIDDWLAFLSRLALRVSTAALVAMTLVIGWQVFGRKVLNASPAWSESLAQLLMLYFVLLAAAVGVREGFHLRFRLLDSLLSPKTVSLLSRLINLAVAGFGVLMVVNGAALATFTSTHVIPTLGISRAVAYWPFVIAGALVVLFATDNFVRGRHGDDRNLGGS